MSLEIDKLYYSVTLDIKGLQKDVEEVKKKIAGMSGDVAKEGGKMDSVFKKLAAAAAAFFSIQAIAGFIKKIIGVRGEFESLGISFETMLKSKEKADKLMAEVIQLAKTTPFTLTEVAAGAKSLLAYGFAATEVTKELKTLGDISAGLSVPLADLVYLYGTTKTQGRVNSKDMMQFAGRGVPIFEELSKVLKVSTQEVRNLVEAGKVGFPDIQKAFQNMTGAGGMFENLMQKQSKSLTGMISNLKDVWGQFLNVLGSGGLGKIIKQVVSDLTSFFGGIVENSNKAKTAIDNFKETVESRDKTKSLLGPLMAEYDLLKSKTILTADEQARLKTVISDIATIAPTAGVGIGEYGEALDINKAKVIAFMEQQQKMTEYMNREAIKEAEALKKKKEREKSIIEGEITSGGRFGVAPGGINVFYSFTPEEINQKRSQISSLQTEVDGLSQAILGLKGDYSAFIVETNNPSGGIAPTPIVDIEERKKAEQEIWEWNRLQLEVQKEISEVLAKRAADRIEKESKVTWTDPKTGEIKTGNVKPDTIAETGKRMNTLLESGKKFIIASKTIEDIWAGITEDMKDPESWQNLSKGFGELSNAFSGLDDEASKFFGQLANISSSVESMVAGIASGNVLQSFTSAVSIATGIGKMFQDAADNGMTFDDVLQQINRDITEYQRLVDLSKRKGGFNEAYQNEIDALETKRELLEKNIQMQEINLKQAEKAGFFGRLGSGVSLNKIKKELADLKNQLKDTENQIEDTSQAWSDFLTGGITEISLASKIAEAFESGKTSVKDFGEYIKDTLKDAVLEAFKAKILGEQLTKVQDYLSGALSDAKLSDREIARFKALYQKAFEDSKELWNNLTSGLPEIFGTGSGSGQSALSGAIKGISEQTADVLAGQFMGLRVDMSKQTQMATQSLTHLANIDNNTFNTVSELKNAVAELKGVNTKLGGSSANSDATLRSSGITA